MKTAKLFGVVWSLLANDDRRRATILGVFLLIGTLLEVLSVGALVPLAQVLSTTRLQSRYPIIDRVFPNSTNQLIAVAILGGVICVFLLKELFLGFSLWMQRGFVSRLELRFQTELFDRYSRQSYEFHLSNNSSLLVRNILNSTNFSNNILDPMIMLATEGFVVVSVCVALVAIEPTAMLITIGSVSVVAMMFHSFSKWRIEKWGTERQFQEGIKLQQMSETFGGIKEVIMTGQVGYFQGLFCSNVRQLAHLNRKFTTILGIPRLYLELLAVVGLAALMLSKLLLGTPPESLLPSLALFGGGAFRLMPAANRIMFALQSLKMGTPIVEVLQSNLTSLQPMELQCNKTTPLQLRRSIRFEDVWYSYPGTEKSAIKGLNLEIVKGSQVGLVGTTGAGKSTVIDILLGLLRPTDGRVTVDGVDIFSNLRGWRESVGYVPQTIYLLDASIRANIAFGISEAGIDDERISRALDLARLSEFVDELPNGVNESVGERGVKLSGGQRQRIGIARALYRNPSIVVFDEATSALDVETENEIMKSLESLRADRTLLIVTHRQSALKGCDQLVTIDDGVVSSLRG